MLYTFLDVTFLVLHTLLIIFNLFGWIFRKTRRINLLTILLTASSWLVFAPWYGLGYCPCTDWHWEVKRRLGETDLPNNYLTYLIEAWTGIAITDFTAERLALGCLTIVLIASISLNVGDIIAQKKDAL